MSGSVAREDLDDLGFVDAVELASDGSVALGQYKTAAAVSTTNATKQVDITGGGYNLNTERDAPPQNGDRIVLVGSTAADGAYTFDAIVSDFVFTVVEAIPDSTGGTVSFRHKPGAIAIGVDPANISNSAGITLQQVLEDLDAAITGGGITAAAHKTLRQAIHFVEDGPGDGFSSGAFKEILPAGSLFPTSETWYVDNSKTDKIFEKLTTRSGGGATNIKPTPIKWKIYDTDGSTVLFTLTDTITYSGIQEATRTRAIVAGDA